MSTVAGIFNSRADAERAAGRLREAGVTEIKKGLTTSDRVATSAPASASKG